MRMTVYIISVHVHVRKYKLLQGLFSNLNEPIATCFELSIFFKLHLPLHFTKFAPKKQDMFWQNLDHDWVN